MRWGLLLAVATLLPGCIAYLEPEPVGPPTSRPAPAATRPESPDPCAGACGGSAGGILRHGSLAMDVQVTSARIVWSRPTGEASPVLSPGDVLHLRIDLGLPASIPLESLAKVTWDFGDGTTHRGGTAEHAWGASGAFNVTARIVALADPRTVFVAREVVAVVGAQIATGTIPLPDDGTCLLPGTTCVDVPVPVEEGVLTLTVRSTLPASPRVVARLVAPNGSVTNASLEHVVVAPDPGVWYARLHLETAFPTKDRPYEVHAVRLPRTTLDESNRDMGFPEEQRGHSV